MVKQPPLKTTNSLALGHSQSLGHIPNLARRIIFLFSRLAYLEAPSTNTECWVKSSEGGAFFFGCLQVFMIANMTLERMIFKCLRNLILLLLTKDVFEDL